MTLCVRISFSTVGEQLKDGRDVRVEPFPQTRFPPLQTHSPVINQRVSIFTEKKFQVSLSDVLYNVPKKKFLGLTLKGGGC